MEKFVVGKIEFGLHQINTHFDAIRNRLQDALMFEDLYYKAEYENEKLREELAKLKGEKNGCEVEGKLGNRVVSKKRKLR